MNHASTAFEMCIQIVVFFVSFNSVLLNDKHNAHKNITDESSKTLNFDFDKEMNKNKQMKSDEFNEMIKTFMKHITKSSSIIYIINKD